MKAGPPMIRALARIAHSGAVSGDEETRTPDFLLAKEALYQLSYVPKRASPAWARQGPKGRGTSPGRRRSTGPEGRPAAGANSIEGPAEWAFVDSNYGPLPYQGSALTS